MYLYVISYFPACLHQQVEFQCEHQVWNRTNRTGAAPVRFALYFESLCPDCKQFITEMLWTTWKKVGKIMDLQLVPYGNAEVRN